MKQFIFSVIFGSMLSSGICQRDTVSLPFGNLYYIKDSTLSDLINDCIFCNPGVMFKDRILLDSTKTMIARKISNPLGYTYYEWRNSRHSKTYEEVNFHGLNFKAVTFYADSGNIIEQWIESSAQFRVTYHVDSWKSIKVLRLSLPTTTKDSLINIYKIQNDKIDPNLTKFWTEIVFYSNGRIKSIGQVVEGLNERESNRYKLGEWIYYNDKGSVIKQETVKTITKFIN